MTIQEFKNVFGFLNPRFKKELPSNYVISNDDILKGGIVQRFINNNNPSSVVDGFTIINNEICYIYQKLQKIEIVSDNVFPSCGGKIDVYVYGIYDMYIVDSNGVDKIKESNKKAKINALISINNNEFVYNKTVLSNNLANNTEKEKEVIISASYYHKATKYKDSKRIVQPVNKISDWDLESETTLGIKLSLSKTKIGKDGGFSIIKVEREFSRLYCKKDSCGNIVARKNEPGHIDDITKNCILTSSNRKIYTITNNIITISKQEPGSLKREGIITARFSDFESTAIITQECGGKISYDSVLSFMDKSDLKAIVLNSSLKDNVIIPIISKEYKYVDGNVASAINSKDLEIKNNCSWLDIASEIGNDSINLLVAAIKPNDSKEDDRECVLSITNKFGKSIKLIITQPSLKKVEEKIYCKFYGNNVYTSEEINSSELYFKLFKTTKFEDGTSITTEINELFKFKAQYESSNENLLTLSSVNYNNGKYEVKLLNLSKHSYENINAKIKLIFDNKDIECETGNITVNCNTVIEYAYEFFFDGKSKYKVVRWKDSTEQKSVVIISLKNTFKNGILINKEYAPFNITPSNDDFLIKNNGDLLTITPGNITKTTNKTYILTQLETGSSLKINLESIITDKKIELPIKVIICSKTVNKDLWTNGGQLSIDGKEILNLTPCWISPIMKDNFDTVYDGKIKLFEGEHTFELTNVIEQSNKSVIKLKKELILDKDTKNILLTALI